jgi:predicted HAD superfamily phosphohydrolase YqeG
MLITFDLDDTLICWQKEIPTESVYKPWYLWWFTPEPLRRGTVDIFQQLRGAGWKIGIYTTSHRRPSYIRRLFRLHGLHLDSITNQDGHEKLVRRIRQKRKPSKIPCFVGSDLHIDNSEGVLIEGQRFHFRVAIVEPMDPAWTEKIWREAERVAASKKKKHDHHEQGSATI